AGKECAHSAGPAIQAIGVGQRFGAAEVFKIEPRHAGDGPADRNPGVLAHIKLPGKCEMNVDANLVFLVRDNLDLAHVPDLVPAHAHLVAGRQPSDIVGQLEAGGGAALWFENIAHSLDRDHDGDDQTDADDNKNAGFEGVAFLSHK